MDMKDVEKLPTTKEQPILHEEKRTTWSRLSRFRLCFLGLCLVLYCLYKQGGGFVSLRQLDLDGMKISNGITRAPGYKLEKVLEESVTRFKASLRLAGEPSNAHGVDVEELVVEAEYESEQRLHVKIYDAAEKAYQIPTNLLPPPPSTQPSSHNLQFHYHPAPFAFWITRRSNDEIIFDTRQLSSPIYPRNMVKENGDSIRDTNMPAHPLIFSDQYLQLSTALPENTNIYGLGEVIASSGIRRDPKGTVQAFWNRDSAGSPHDSNMYGTHPFYIEKRLTSKGSLSHGVFIKTSHGLDVILRPKTLQYRILGGVFDMYFFSGPSPTHVIQQYAEVIGKPAQMPFWTFGFHLCRFGYASIEETREAVEKMEAEGIPMESIWNDLDHMNHRRDFDLAPSFPGDKFKAFTDWVHSRSQHYVPIVDVAIGVPYSSSDNYPPYTSGHAKDVFIHSKNGSEHIGKVWPGDTVFPDWTNPATDGWWKECLDEYRAKGVQYDGIWCDMNEPASFDAEFDGKPKTEIEILTGHGPVDMGKGDGAKEEHGQKDKWDYPSYAIHQDWKSLPDHTVPPSSKLYDGTRAYDSHNTYGFEEIISTHKALTAQAPSKRPFILSRSTFAGQGKYSAHWLGDNYSTWQSLRDSLQGVLQFQWFQIPMVGPDACGFTGNATEELCNRWYGLSAFFPFYRSHNSIEYTGQEPYVWPKVAEATKTVLKIRYSLLPFWESLFAQAHEHGIPPLQPLFFAFDDPALASVEQQFLIGSSILVTPVLYEGATIVRGYFPSEKGTTWRDWYTHEVVETDSDDQATLSAPLGHIPLHIRSGSIILIHNEPKYTLTETRQGDYGLIVNLDAESLAEAVFNLDDGMSVDGANRIITLRATENKLQVTSEGSYAVQQRLSKLTILGCPTPLSLASFGESISVEWHEKTGTTVISGLNIDLNESTEILL